MPIYIIRVLYTLSSIYLIKYVKFSSVKHLNHMQLKQCGRNAIQSEILKIRDKMISIQISLLSGIKDNKRFSGCLSCTKLCSKNIIFSYSLNPNNNSIK